MSYLSYILSIFFLFLLPSRRVPYYIPPSMKKLSILASTLIALTGMVSADIQAPPGADYTSTRKLGRAVGNILYGIMEIPGGIKTDQAFDAMTFEIGFTDEEAYILRSCLETMNEQKTLNVGNMELFKKFGCSDVTEGKLIDDLENKAGDHPKASGHP